MSCHAISMWRWGRWRMVSSMLSTLDVPLEDGVEPWPPHGVSPSGPSPVRGVRVGVTRLSSFGHVRRERDHPRRAADRSVHCRTIATWRAT
jgi:hypothetical protein